MKASTLTRVYSSEYDCSGAVEFPVSLLEAALLDARPSEVVAPRSVFVPVYCRSRKTRMLEPGGGLLFSVTLRSVPGRRPETVMQSSEERLEPEP